MSIYIWIVASIGYLFALDKLVFLLSLKYKKMLDKETAAILLIRFAFWFVLATAGFALVLVQ